MTHNETLDAAGINLDSVLGYIDIARQAVNDGLLGYALIIAEKPR